jgi:hypothetical protein
VTTRALDEALEGDELTSRRPEIVTDALRLLGCKGACALRWTSFRSFLDFYFPGRRPN